MGSSLFRFWSGQFDLDVPALHVQGLLLNHTLGSVGTILKRDETKTTRPIRRLINHDNGIHDGSEFFKNLLELVAIHAGRNA